MNEITFIIDWIQNIGFIGILVVLAIPSLRRKIFGLNGNGNYQPQIDALAEHASVANEEMGKMQKSVKHIETDVAFIKGKMSK